jgi:hypothetical protein
MEEILRMTNPQNDMAQLTVALNVVDNAFQLLSMTLERPLASMASIYWRRVLSGITQLPNPVTVVDTNELYADGTGTLYYVYPSKRVELASLDQGSDVQDGIIVPKLSRDGWLKKEAVRMDRIIADPITVALDVPLWTVGMDTANALSNDISDAISNIAQAVIGAVQDTTLAPIVTMPVIVFSPAADNPFQANTHISCRFGQALAHLL